jgi:hypothetical protein
MAYGRREAGGVIKQRKTVQRSVQQPVASSLDWNKLPPLSRGKELAAFLGLKEKTLRTWRHKGVEYAPPCVHFGASVFYERDSVRVWYEYVVLSQIRGEAV